MITQATFMGDQLHFTVITGIQGKEVKMSLDGHVSGGAMYGSV